MRGVGLPCDVLDFVRARNRNNKNNQSAGFWGGHIHSFWGLVMKGLEWGIPINPKPYKPYKP